MEWISAKERLPDYDSFFLAYTDDCNYYVGWFWACEWLPCFGNVTHWMPLPKPPKE